MNRYFPVLGTEIPDIVGREDVLQRLFNELTKPTPSHISIVGPRFSGKSVIIKGLIKKLKEQGSPFCGISYWDLGHQTPLSDEDFFRLMSYNLGKCLEKVDPEYGEYLKDKGAGHGEIREVINALDLNQQRVLMLWDGFDKPLGSGNLTRNLWDNLLNLCRQPGLRVVTCTRKELHKLIRDEQSVTSDFWGIFDGVTRVGVFKEKDIDEIITVRAGLKFSAGARTELMNWTSGFPPLFLGLLNQIMDGHDQGEVDNETVNQAALKACDKYSPILSRLWDDCTASAQDLYVYLNKSGQMSSAEAGKAEIRDLVEKGFAREAGSKLFPGCRMLREHIRQEEPDIGNMARLFGSWEAYRRNIRDLLQRRLSHIRRFDDRLFRYVEMAIKDLPEYTDSCLYNLTGIRDRALHLIWEKELGPVLLIPADVVSYWTAIPRSSDKLIQQMMQDNQWCLSHNSLHQIRLLGLMTGCHPNFENKAKAISKDSYILIDTIHSFRNRTQHPDGQSIRVGVAVASLMACIELLACLEREIGN